MGVLALIFTVASTVSAQMEHFCGHAEKIQTYPVPPRPAATESQGEPTRSPYIIPVVFHVLHINGPENVSDSQITNALAAINEDFNKLNADRSQVIPEYANNVADVGVTLQLARFDPNGNPTSGINRIYTTLTNHGIDDSAKINQWPQSDYLNIWVVKDLGGSAAAVSFIPIMHSFIRNWMVSWYSTTTWVIPVLPRRFPAMQ